MISQDFLTTLPIADLIEIVRGVSEEMKSSTSFKMVEAEIDRRVDRFNRPWEKA